MNPTLRVQAGPQDNQRYQDLLQADWSRESFEDVLSLLWKYIAASAKPSSHLWQQVLEFGPGMKSGKDLNQDILARIRELAHVLTESSIPGMPGEFTPKKSRSVVLAEKAWAFLVLQAMAGLRGETGLFMDTQSLLFLCCIHYLLPQLKQQGLEGEHDCLVNALYIHTLLVWRKQPAHLFYLQGLLMDHMGDHQRRLELLDVSLRLTPVEDHSYLTKATAYWSDLMDLGRQKEALDFLLALNRYSPLAYQDEIGEMIGETLAGARTA
jgi:tetratricopeptide (TPR) repeat protein